MKLKDKILLVPKQINATTKCVLLLHGIGGDIHTLEEIGQQLPKDCLVIALEAPFAMAEGGYEWYFIDFTKSPPEHHLGQFEQSRIAIFDYIQKLMDTYQITIGNFFLVGFSQGGIISLDLALERPDLFQGMSVLSGRLSLKPTTEIAPLAALKKLKVLFIHGNKDTILPPKVAKEAMAFCEEHQMDTTYLELDIEHEVVATEGKLISEWMEAIAGVKI